MTRETDLYQPVKTFLEGQGYEVKSEVGAADVVALRAGEDDPVIVELKTAFSLTLVHQGVARQAVTDWVYLAIPRGSGRRWLAALKANKSLLRRLGLGLITVRLSDGLLEVVQDPAPYTPRKSKPRKTRLLREFARRTGDPNTGGATRQGLITAYRQDAVRCARHLLAEGPSKGAHVAKATGVAKATAMMAADHYGWFERVEKGIYALTPKGQAALTEYKDAL
ncbi:DUF2161 domain-containing phosphodiesterase [Alphaproteobacteria bacterium KMM 3653]|uniref:DUF2161 domain-containing phosphodiesterase n=1 Tax=Harenicola maris TaxID=2841044 RepID=A0AAP2CT83_9RHOB|nr:DUF2161 domain-containing phosphodiesterase [Harenicola maris]